MMLLIAKRAADPNSFLTQQLSQALLFWLILKNNDLRWPESFSPGLSRYISNSRLKTPNFARLATHWCGALVQSNDNWILNQ